MHQNGQTRQKDGGGGGGGKKTGKPPPPKENREEEHRHFWAGEELKKISQVKYARKSRPETDKGGVIVSGRH